MRKFIHAIASRVKKGAKPFIQNEYNKIFCWYNIRHLNPIEKIRQRDRRRSHEIGVSFMFLKKVVITLN